MSLVFVRFLGLFENRPLLDKGRLRRGFILRSVLFVRDLVGSVLQGGGMVRLVGPGQRPLERYEFETREVRFDLSSRG